MFSNCQDATLPPAPLYSTVDITTPIATDNSGSVASITVDPSTFLPGQPLPFDLNVTYTVTDWAGLTETCVKQYLVLGESFNK